MRSLLLALVASLILAAPAAASPSWLAPVDLGPETQDTSSVGRVALGADGTAVAAWAQWIPSSSNWVLQVSRRRPGEGFGAAITVPNTIGVETLNVRVGVDGAGNATILYRLSGALVVVPWPAASAEPGTVQPLPNGSSPELAVGRGGTAVATWIDDSNVNNPRVRAAVRSGASGDFGPGDLISDFGNGIGSITGLRAAVGDGGHATVVWSRTNLVPQTLVEANERAPGGAFSNTAVFNSDTLAGPATEPAVAVDASGRSTALWTHAGSGQVRYAEHAPGQAFWSGEERASRDGATASTPVAAAAPNGVVVAAWVSNSAMEAAARSGGGAFADHRPLSGPSMTTFSPLIAVGGNGDALIAWSVTDQKAIFTVQRTANGAFGPLLTAIANPPGENQNFFEPSIGMDDEGNGVAAWTRNANRNAVDFYRFQAASFDAAAPALTSSVPPGAVVAAPIGMAAAASDRVSPVALAWSFGDGAAATGGAVSHAFGSPGAFNVTVTATDAAGNQTSRSHPVLVRAGAPPPRIDSSVSVGWAFNRKRVFLTRMRVNAPPKGAKAELRCSGKKCPFKKRKVGKIRRNALTLFKTLKATKAATKKNRTFRPGQLVQLRITAKGFTGKVVKYPIKKRRIPVGRTLCLPEGAKKPRKC